MLYRDIMAKYFIFEGHSSTAMFISEIPVRCMSSADNSENIIKWIKNLNNRTTARDVIQSVLPTDDSTKYSLYIHTDRKKLVLNDASCIYKVIGKINQEKCSRRLLFEVRLKKKVKKHVRFADEIIVQNIVQRRCLSNEIIRNNFIETISIPRENFQQQTYVKIPSKQKR